MLDDLTPEEISLIILMSNSMPDGCCLFHENKLYLMEHHPVFKSLSEKLSEALKRDDVKAYNEQQAEGLIG